MKLNKARNVRTTICHCFHCLDLKIKKDHVRCMLQFSIFPASATKIQKFLLRTRANKTDRPTHFIFQWSGYGKQTIS